MPSIYVWKVGVGTPFAISRPKFVPSFQWTHAPAKESANTKAKRLNLPPNPGKIGSNTTTTSPVIRSATKYLRS